MTDGHSDRHADAHMTNRRMAPPLRVTERVDYALKSVLFLAMHEDEYVTAKAVASHYGMSLKLLGGVLWCLRAAGILDSRRGWHGGFRLAILPEAIPLQAVIAAASGDEHPRPKSSTATTDVEPLLDAPPIEDRAVEDRAANLVAGFWQALDGHIQGTLATFTVADLAAERGLS